MGEQKKTLADLLEEVFLQTAQIFHLKISELSVPYGNNHTALWKIFPFKDVFIVFSRNCMQDFGPHEARLCIWDTEPTLETLKTDGGEAYCMWCFESKKHISGNSGDVSQIISSTKGLSRYEPFSVLDPAYSSIQFLEGKMVTLYKRRRYDYVPLQIKMVGIE